MKMYFGHPAAIWDTGSGDDTINQWWPGKLNYTTAKEQIEYKFIQPGAEGGYDVASVFLPKWALRFPGIFPGANAPVGPIPLCETWPSWKASSIWQITTLKSNQCDF